MDCTFPNCTFDASMTVGGIDLCGLHAADFIALIEARRSRRLATALTAAIEAVAA